MVGIIRLIGQLKAVPTTAQTAKACPANRLRWALTRSPLIGMCVRPDSGMCVHVIQRPKACTSPASEG